MSQLCRAGAQGAIIRFRIPADRDVLVHIYEPITAYPFPSKEFSPKPKFSVPVYQHEVSPEIAVQIGMHHKNRKELETPLRGYAISAIRPEVKANCEIMELLVRARELALARNLTLDHAFDGMELWAEAEFRDAYNFGYERETDMRYRRYRKEPEKRLVLRFVEVHV